MHIKHDRSLDMLHQRLLRIFRFHAVQEDAFRLIGRQLDESRWLQSPFRGARVLYRTPAGVYLRWWSMENFFAILVDPQFAFGVRGALCTWLRLQLCRFCFRTYRLSRWPRV